MPSTVRSPSGSLERAREPMGEAVPTAGPFMYLYGIIHRIEDVRQARIYRVTTRLPGIAGWEIRKKTSGTDQTRRRRGARTSARFRALRRARARLARFCRATRPLDAIRAAPSPDNSRG